MKKVLALVVALAMVFVVGCGAFGPVGFLYTGVKSPMHFATGETSNPGSSAITGESCGMSILGLIAIGDYSIDSALKAAGAEGKTLKNVAVDGRMMSILGALYAQFCTRVTAQVAQ
jgi:hypothetical protein